LNDEIVAFGEFGKIDLRFWRKKYIVFSLENRSKKSEIFINGGFMMEILTVTHRGKRLRERNGRYFFRLDG
jgi:hypothetical protein